jgi:hypothetical protein
VDLFSNSNNGDIVKVFATIIQILRGFTLEYRSIQVAFIGSTLKRTLLYRRILKTYYDTFSNEFIITALVDRGRGLKEILFDPGSTEEYLAFLVKRI